MDTAFECDDEEEIFKQFDCKPISSPTKIKESCISLGTSSSSSSSVAQNPVPVSCHYVSKTEILNILNTIESSLARTSSWIGKKRSLKKKFETLQQLKQKIEAFPEDMNLSMAMDKAIAPPTSCIPQLFGRNPNRIIEKRLSHALEFLDEYMNRNNDHDGESDRATIGGGSFADENDEGLELKSAPSHLGLDFSCTDGDSSLSKNSSVVTQSNYDADTERAGPHDSDDVVITTTCSNVENDLDPLGVSITTWSRRKISCEAMISKTPSQSQLTLSGAEATSGSDEEEEEEESLEEVKVAFGNVVVRHARRSRSVRFTGIKPTTEDNISRAMELLRNAKLMRAKHMASSSSE